MGTETPQLAHTPGEIATCPTCGNEYCSDDNPEIFKRITSGKKRKRPLTGLQDPAGAIREAREALEIGESWMKHTIEDTEWTDDEFAKKAHTKAKVELATVRAALAKLMR